MRRLLTALALVGLVLIAPLSAQSTRQKLEQIQTLVAELIAAYPTSLTVNPGDDLQKILATAPEGVTELDLTPGVYKVNLKLLAGKSLTIRTADVWLPMQPGKPWLDGPMMAGKLAQLVPLDPAYPVITAENRSRDYNLIGLEIGPNTAMPDRSLVWLGDPTTVAVAEDAPQNINMDLCYVHGDPVKGGHQGILLGTKGSAITRSYISGFLEQGRDSQGISTYNGPGDYLVENNYIEASGENFLTGGADPKIPGLLPTNIVVRGNYFFKPLEWKTKPGSVKNLFELKVGKNVLVENNVFENSWVDQQVGHGIAITVRDQSGTAPQSTISDVVFRYNIIKNVAGFYFNILGLDDTGHASVQAQNLLIEHTLGLSAKSGLQMTWGGFWPTMVRHNTFLGLRGQLMALGSKHPMQAGSLSVIDNVFPGGEFGIGGELNEVIGTTALLSGAPGAVFSTNVIEGTASRKISYPTGNYPIPPATLAGKLDSLFHYIGTETSSDGTPLGANVDELRRRIPWFVF